MLSFQRLVRMNATVFVAVAVAVAVAVNDHVNADDNDDVPSNRSE